MNTRSIATRILLALGATTTALGAASAGCGSTTNISVATGAGGAGGHDGTGGANGASTTASSTGTGLGGGGGAGGGTGGMASDGGDDAADAKADGPPCIRRPFLVDDAPRAGAIAERGDWGRALIPAEIAVDEGTRAALAQAWAIDGTREHASIAAFSRFTLLLVAVGASPEMVVGSQKASLDEVAHARDCFALAGRYAGKALGPGPVSLRGALPADPSLADVAALTVHEGCVGETLGVLLATEQLAGATDPAVRAVLERVVRDEQRHAELAWRLVRWALDEGGEPVRAAVERAFDEAVHVTRAMIFGAGAPVDEAAWRAHGRLSPAQANALVHQGLAEIVSPCRRALLAGEPHRPRPDLHA